jgi:glutaminyl-tRNA synthetase
MVEPTMVNAKPEMAYQFEREGYYCRDNQLSDELIFNKTVGLRDTYS